MFVHRFDGWNQNYGPNFGSNGFTVYTVHGERLAAAPWIDGYLNGGTIDVEAIVNQELLDWAGVVDGWSFDWYHIPVVGDPDPDPRHEELHNALNAYIAIQDSISDPNDPRKKIKFMIMPIMDAPYALPHPPSNPWQYVDDGTYPTAIATTLTHAQYHKTPSGIPFLPMFLQTVPDVARFDALATYLPPFILITCNGRKAATDTVSANPKVVAKALSFYGPNNLNSGGHLPWSNQRDQDRSKWGSAPGYFEVAPINVFNDAHPISPTEIIDYVDPPSQPDYVEQLQAAKNSGVVMILIYAWNELGEGGPGIVPTSAAQEGTRFRDGLKWARGWPRPPIYTYQINCNSLYFTTNGTFDWIRPRRDTSAVGVPGNNGYSEMTSSTTGDYKEISHIRWRKVGLRVQTGPDRGIVEMSVNGVFIANVDLYSPTFVPHVLVWEHNLNGSNNTVRATVTGTKNGSSSSVLIGLNTFEITYEP